MKRRFHLSFLLLAGILMLGAGLIGLTTVPDLMQYAFIPQAETDALTQAPYQAETEALTPEPSDEDADSVSRPATEIKTVMLDKYDKALQDMGSIFPKLTLHGIRNDTGLDVNERPQNVCLYAIGPSWNEVYTPRIVNGRALVRLDAEQQNDVIILDEKTAFAFFHAEDPIGRTVNLNGTEMEVVGVAAHSRRIGETMENAAWVPLDKVTDCELMVLSAASSTAGLFSVFRDQAQSCFGSNGTAISLVKEKTRARMPLLLVFLVVAIWLLKRWIKWLGGYGRARVAEVRAESRRRYALQLIPYLAGKLLPVALMIIATAAACYGVAVLAVKPLWTFPEWVPETLGEYPSWISKFWDLTSAAAKTITIKTTELAEVQFWSSLILWGTILILLRAAKNTLAGFGRKKED